MNRQDDHRKFILKSNLIEFVTFKSFIIMVGNVEAWCGEKSDKLGARWQQEVDHFAERS